MSMQTDYMPDRFEPPRASVTRLPGGGTSFMGLPDRNGKHILKHSFEASKAAKNLADEDAALEVPVGQRHDGQRDFEQQLQQKRMSYNDWKRPNKDPSREHLTSVDNPLRNLVVIPQPEVQPPVQAIKTYSRNTHKGNMVHLAPGTLEPLSKAEVRSARASANRASRVSSPARQGGTESQPPEARSRPKRHWDQAGEAQAGEQEEGPIAEGSEEGEDEEEEYEEGSSQISADDQGELSKLDCSEREALRNTALQEIAEEIKQIKEVEDRLIREYPHGVPRLVIARVQKELGLRLPSLGFGEAQSLSDKMAKASLRA